MDMRQLQQDQELLASGWPVVARYHHEWRTDRGGWASVSGGPFASVAECRNAKFKALRDAGYTPPRWWQWWRWGERKP